MDTCLALRGVSELDEDEVAAQLLFGRGRAGGRGRVAIGGERVACGVWRPPCSSIAYSYTSTQGAILQPIVRDVL